jgi:hypothetical protein
MSAKFMRPGIKRERERGREGEREREKGSDAYLNVT